MVEIETSSRMQTFDIEYQSSELFAISQSLLKSFLRVKKKKKKKRKGETYERFKFLRGKIKEIWLAVSVKNF